MDVNLPMNAHRACYNVLVKGRSDSKLLRMENPGTPEILSSSEYQTLVEQSPILIWRSGTDMLCNYFNERWLAFTGRTMDQEIGNGWTEGVHSEDFDRCLQIYTSHFEREEIFEMEYRLKRHDGEYRWIFDRGVPFYPDGVFAGYIGSCIDVHTRVEAEAELERHRIGQLERLERLLPMCAWCGRIRNDQGYWQDVAQYLTEHGFGSATHGICKKCKQEVEGR